MPNDLYRLGEHHLSRAAAEQIVKQAKDRGIDAWFEGDLVLMSAPLERLNISPEVAELLKKMRTGHA